MSKSGKKHIGNLGIDFLPSQDKKPDTAQNKADKLLLLQETFEDLLSETRPYSQEWRTLLQSGFTLAEGYALIKPDVATGFYNNIITACESCENTDEGHAVLRRAFNGLARVPKQGIERYYGL